MGNLTSSLTLKLIDDGLAAKVKADADAMRKLGASAQDLKKLGGSSSHVAQLNKELDALAKKGGKLEALKVNERQLSTLAATYKTARQEVAATAKAVAALGPGVSAKDQRAAERAHKAAMRRMDAARDAALEQARLVKAAHAEALGGSGKGRIGMARAEHELAAATNATNAALREQVGLVGRLAAKGRAERDVLAGMGLAGRGQATKIAADRRLVDGMGAPARAAAAAAAAAAKAAVEAETRRRSSASGDMLRGMGGIGRREHERIAAGRRVAEGMSAAGRRTGSMAGGSLPQAGDAEGSAIFDTLKGVGASAAARRAFEATTTNWSTMDEAIRRQRAILSIDEEQQAQLKAQAYQIGKDTRFTNPDVVKGQTRIGSSLPDHLKNPAVIAAITENAKNYALAMGTTLDEGSSAILGRMLGLRMDMSTPATAGAASLDAANSLVQWAKASGADHNDVMGYTKFGAAPGNVGGFSPEFSDALSAQLRRIGFEGSMGGNFVRAAATKLAVPTSKGLGALAAAGIDHGEYVQKGKELSAENLNKSLKLKYGKGLTDSQQARIHALMQDETVVGNRDEFVPQVSEIVQETLARKTKKGTINAQDAKSIAKTVNEFLNVSAGAVDIQRLMRDVIPLLKGSPALSKYLFGQEHGGRAQALDRETLDKDTESFRNTPRDRAKGVGDITNAGFHGARDRYYGSVETFWTRLGEVADGPLTTFYNVLGNSIDRVSGLPDALLGVGTAAAAAGAALLGIKGAAGAGALLGLPGAAAVSAGASAAGGVATVAAGGAMATAIANEAIKNKEFAAPYLDGGMLGADPAGYGIGAGIMHAPEALKQMSDENRRRMGSLPPGMAGVPAQLPPRLPGLDGRPKVAPAPASQPVTLNPGDELPGVASSLEQVSTKADQARSSLEQVNGVKVEPSVSTGGLDALLSKANEVIAALGRIPGMVASANTSIASVNSGSTLKSRSFSDGATPGRGTD